MNRLPVITIAAAIIAISPSALGCDYPKRVDIPNGVTASKDEMLAGQRAVKDYMAAMEDYLACLEREEEATLTAMPDITEEERTARSSNLTKKHNAAIEEMELTAARFNEAVRAYKAQSD